MKTPEQLINNVIGQMEGVSRMMKENKDCFEVLNQMKAARAGFDSVIKNFLEANLSACMKKSVKSGDKERVKDLLAQLMKN